MPASLLKSKLYIPPVRPGLVLRPRLIRRLQAGLDCKLTLISAPAGFGKTVLLSEWIAGCGKPSAWVSLDKGDNDLGRFLAYFIAALQQIQPETGAATQAILDSSPFVTARLPTETLLSGLVNEIAEIPTPFILVLDDYHSISESTVHEVLKFIIENKPQPMHLVISSRADPPLPLARLRARRQLNELRVNDLRFTLEEASTFLNFAMKLELKPEDLALLEERTEGWIAGLQMAALSMQGRRDSQDFVAAFAGSHHFISDFLVEEVLNQQPADIREFLLKTSILERLTPALCDAVSGRSDSRVLLMRLEQANLFLMAMDDERRWYRYHHLFRDLLRSSLDNLQPGEAPVLHQLASQWYASAGIYDDAISHAFACKNLAMAAGLVEQAAAPLDIENKLVTITHWIEALPEEMIRARPWLCVYRAWGSQWMGERHQVETWLRAAEQALQQSNLPEADRQHIAGYIAAIRSHHALIEEDIPGVLENSRKALELLPEGDAMRTETAVALGGAYWGLGDVVKSEGAFNMARVNALKGVYLSMAVPSTCYVGMQQTKQGRLKEAMATYHDALQHATAPGGKELPVAGFPNIKIGDLLREWNDLETASQHLGRGVQQCSQLGQADVLADGFVGLARLEIARGKLDRAHQTLLKARQVTERTKVDPFVLCWLDDCWLRLWLAKGDLAAAIRWENASGLQPDGELSYHYDLHHINLARLLVARGRLEPDSTFLKDAQGLLERLLAAAENAGWVQEQIKILILQTFVLRANGDGAAAFTPLEHALRLAAPGGYVRLFIDEGDEMRKLLEDCCLKVGKSNPALTAYIARLRAEFADQKESAIPPKAAHPPASLINEPLTDRELVVVRLLASSMTSNEIAEVLYIAPSTVRTHIKRIYSKLSVNRRMEAVQRAKELGMI